ncbi:hypothetical protein [Persicobacter diffluens]|uniref:Glycoamylase-like domain-containing protein n=1 Tax=Persicobacter diffluens TaxID=981 RepID=A0AAN4W166_9BACT|nr:hypothetical protein PEDI_33880 [Persicobacter diffluens]
MRKLLFLLMLLLCFNLQAQQSDEEILYTQFRNTYKVYQMLRHENGLYHDMVRTDGPTDRGSSANIGMGLVSLCVGHQMGWEPEAEAKIIHTFKAVLGEYENGVKLDRNAKNCFIHFFHIESGKPMGKNYSPIDTDLMIGGALFAKRYFNESKEIAHYADLLWSMVDQTAFIADTDEGKVMLNMLKNGEKGKNSIGPYNEYMIVNWMAKNHGPEGKKLWKNSYEDPQQLKRAVYITNAGEEIPVISPSTTRFTSMFTFMFNFMFVHEFSNSEAYRAEMKNAALADRAWWHDRTELEAKGKQPYEWGTTAGVGLKADKNGQIKESYSVDRICLNDKVGTQADQNPYRNVAPSAMAGFSPVLPEIVAADLIALWKDPRNVGKMELPKRAGISDGGDYILWKYSYHDLNWKPHKVEGVDYGCMLLGMAALPQHLGPEFFNTFNDFFNPERPEYTQP